MDESSLMDGVFVVTGGTQGLGEAIARHLARSGAGGLALCGRTQDKGQRLAEEIESTGTPTVFVQADLLEPRDCRKVVQACQEKFGRVNGLVNAAASTARGNIETTSVEDWDRMMQLNVRAPFILSQECVRVMRRHKTGGSIVNILSVSSYGGQPKLMAYCTSKGALATLTKNLAYALREDRIRVNGINLGWMVTPAEHDIQMAEGQPDNWLELADRRSPFGRILRPEEVARLVGFLLGEEGAMMTGSLIDFDHNVIVGAFD